MHMTHILIVEDDAVLSSGIALTLKENARHFTQCADISSAKATFLTRQFELVILDINLPDGSGLELCRWMRDLSEVPILFLTVNDTEMDIVLGLETGGDDYLTKPFSLAVLRARVSALLRRGGTTAGFSNKIEIDRFSFDFERMIFEKDGVSIELSKTEQRLLFLLVQNKGQTLSREKLSERVWQNGTDYVDENALSVAIRRLRGKLEDDPSAPAYIKTVFGVGYTWAVK
jgi:DNA-binding response OmpR family regulator